ncbi:APC family permease [Dokdonella sp.]|uniref:APC family permease n=1 Tax=Dokdonella sp. TaxID=2291710 RepID=UPI003C452268
MSESVPPVSTTHRGHLLRVLGVAFGLAVMVGMTIGMGILRTPGEIAALVPSTHMFLLVWVLGAVYALLGAMSLSELATLRPRSGGLYPMVHDALGPFAGFVSGWTDSLAYCGTIAGVAIVFGEYIGPLVPLLDGHEGLTGSAVVIAFTLLQWQGVRVGNVVQLLTSSLKGLSLVALAIAALVMTAPVAPTSVVLSNAPVMPMGIALIAAVVVALQSAILTYDGWSAPTYFGEEIKDPGREIPRSIIGGVILVMLIYMALNLAFLHVLGIEAMAGDPFVAASTASRLFGPAGDTVMRVLMLVSLLAAVNALLLSGSRVSYAMSCDELMPAILKRVNRGGTPIYGLLLQSAVVLALVATNTFNTLVSLLAFFFVANYVLVFSSLFVQRRRVPEAPRPFRVPFYPVVPGLALAGSVAFLVATIWSDRNNSLIATGLLLASWPAFRLMRLWMKADVADK